MKVMVWRAASVIITAVTTYAYTGDMLSASKLTAILHSVLIPSHYLFETLWDRIGKNECR
jgi:uncharacterized membrane protein